MTETALKDRRKEILRTLRSPSVLIDRRRLREELKGIAAQLATIAGEKLEKSGKKGWVKQPEQP